MKNCNRRSTLERSVKIIDTQNYNCHNIESAVKNLRKFHSYTKSDENKMIYKVLQTDSVNLILMRNKGFLSNVTQNQNSKLHSIFYFSVERAYSSIFRF